MSDHASFLAAVLANPTDYLPRRVYADYLEENGDADWAELIRISSPDVNGPILRTRIGKRWMRLARRLVGPSVPKSWVVWPISDPAVYPISGETGSWEEVCGSTHFSHTNTHLIVGFRHGFIDAVAAPINRLRKALPAVCRLQPVTRVAVTGLFLDQEMYAVPGNNWRDAGPDRRIIQQRGNSIPLDIWERLTSPVVRGANEPHRVYQDLNAAHTALGQAVLCWARECPPEDATGGTTATASV